MIGSPIYKEFDSWSAEMSVQFEAARPVFQTFFLPYRPTYSLNLSLNVCSRRYVKFEIDFGRQCEKEALEHLEGGREVDIAREARSEELMVFFFSFSFSFSAIMGPNSLSYSRDKPLLRKLQVMPWT